MCIEADMFEVRSSNVYKIVRISRENLNEDRVKKNLNLKLRLFPLNAK